MPHLRWPDHQHDPWLDPPGGARHNGDRMVVSAAPHAPGRARLPRRDTRRRSRPAGNAEARADAGTTSQGAGAGRVLPKARRTGALAPAQGRAVVGAPVMRQAPRTTTPVAGAWR